MQKQQQPRHHAANTIHGPLPATLWCCAILIGTPATAATPIIDTEPPTNVTVTEPGGQTYTTSHPVITLDMKSQVASIVTATDTTSAGSPSTDFPGYPTGRIGPLSPGHHAITWSATDLGNNSYSVEQKVEVVPEVNFAVDQTVGEGNSNVTVTAFLNGKAPIYPVTLKYTVGGTATGGNVDHDAADGTIVISDGNTSGSVTFAVANDNVNDADETVIFTLKTGQGDIEADRVQAGTKVNHTVTIKEINLPPILTISASQNGGPQTRVITTDGGAVTLSASAYDPNGDTVGNFDWSASDAALAPVSGSSGTTFTFNPTGLAAGVYTARLTASDGTASSTRDFTLRVYTTPPVLSASEDADDDGIKDSADSFQDGDGDGIPDYLDAVTTPSLLPGWGLLTYKADLKRSDTFVSGPITFSWQLDKDATATASNRVYYPLLLATEPGLKLNIGPVAFSSGSSHGRIDTAAAALYFGNSPAEGLVSADGQVIDIEITGLGSTGQSVYLVIPQAAPLPPGSPIFKVIGKDHTWKNFTNEGSGGKNALLYRTAKKDGYCPPPGSDGSDGYTAVAANSNALDAGIACIEVRIEDGGDNDYDGQVNGVIRLLGAPFVSADSVTGEPIIPSEYDGDTEGSVESLNKIRLKHGGGGLGYTGLWSLAGLLLALWLRRR